MFLCETVSRTTESSSLRSHDLICSSTFSRRIWCRWIECFYTFSLKPAAKRQLMDLHSTCKDNWNTLYGSRSTIVYAKTLSSGSDRSEVGIKRLVSWEFFKRQSLPTPVSTFRQQTSGMTCRRKRRFSHKYGLWYSSKRVYSSQSSKVGYGLFVIRNVVSTMTRIQLTVP
jgi:hypothetical protein